MSHPPSSPPGIIQHRSDLTSGTVFWVHSKRLPNTSYDEVRHGVRMSERIMPMDRQPDIRRCAVPYSWRGVQINLWL